MPLHCHVWFGCLPIGIQLWRGADGRHLFLPETMKASGHRGAHLLLLQQGYFFNGKHDVYIYIYGIYIYMVCIYIYIWYIYIWYIYICMVYIYIYGIYTKLTAFSIWIKDMYILVCVYIWYVCKHMQSPHFPKILRGTWQFFPAGSAGQGSCEWKTGTERMVDLLVFNKIK